MEFDKLLPEILDDHFLRVGPDRLCHLRSRASDALSRGLNLLPHVGFVFGIVDREPAHRILAGLGIGHGE